MIEEACPGDGRSPDMVKYIPLSKIARNLERREKTLGQCLACGGTVGDATLLIKPGSQGSSKPTCVLPTSRGKGKAATNSVASGHLRAKVAWTTQFGDAPGSSLHPPPLRPAPAGLVEVQPLLLQDQGVLGRCLGEA
uniref:Uncharacterized protein n=1 Tax=Cannabis sativa TaxID=3483 RepID=A0A803Q739_CANSA